MNTSDTTTTKRPKAGHERLILENGQHYWLQSNGSKRKTDWQLIDGRAVLRCTCDSGRQITFNTPLK